MCNIIVKQYMLILIFIFLPLNHAALLVLWLQQSLPPTVVVNCYLIDWIDI